MKAALLVSAAVLFAAPALTSANFGVALPAYTRQQLPNGTVIYLAPRLEIPLVHIHAVVRGGTESDPPALGGLSSAVADLLWHGTETRSAATFSRDLASPLNFFPVTPSVGWTCWPVPSSLLSFPCLKCAISWASQSTMRWPPRIRPDWWQHFTFVHCCSGPGTRTVIRWVATRCHWAASREPTSSRTIGGCTWAGISY